jgi:hypothetical protein
MAALADIRNDAAHIMSVLHGSVANFQITQGNFVTEWHGIEGLEANGLVGFHDPTGDFLAWLDVLDNHDAHGVGFVMHDKISGHEILSPPQICV